VTLAAHDADDRAHRRYLVPAQGATRRDDARLVTEADVQSVSLFMTASRRKALRAVFDEFVEEVVAPVLMAPDPPAVTELLDASHERARVALQFMSKAFDDYELRALDQVVRDQFADYLTGARAHKPPRIRREAKAAHDDAFALIIPSRKRMRRLRMGPPATFSDQLSRRLTRVTIDVEVLSLAVMMAMTRARKARNLELLEHLVFSLFNAARFLYAFANEATSIAAVPRGAERMFVHELRAPTGTFLLREGVDVDVAPEDDRFTAYLHVVPLRGEGATRDEALTSLAEHFAAAWDAVTSPGVDELSLDAVAQRTRLLELVDTGKML
jgi:hypothetical protein